MILVISCGVSVDGNLYFIISRKTSFLEGSMT
jgi:hypothetical protein